MKLPVRRYFALLVTYLKPLWRRTLLLALLLLAGIGLQLLNPQILAYFIDTALAGGASTSLLVREAELLVFDDISSALDVETERTLWEQLFNQRRHTYLVVSHRRAVLQRANSILILKDSKIATAGPLNELLESSEEMQKLWESSP
jgi:ABC-type multidrug transport system fused ATPase/permease subunit